jgi:hypothetical protein
LARPSQQLFLIKEVALAALCFLEL